MPRWPFFGTKGLVFSSKPASYLSETLPVTQPATIHMPTHTSPPRTPQENHQDLIMIFILSTLLLALAVRPANAHGTRRQAAPARPPSPPPTSARPQPPRGTATSLQTRGRSGRAPRSSTRLTWPTSPPDALRPTLVLMLKKPLGITSTSPTQKWPSNLTRT